MSLDTAVRFAIDRGASVRLIGDDQQLAAIGAGGVLRDIKNIHGALQLTELHRFTVPAEAQASLALREGDLSAIGFYLDHGRVHVGDLAKITEDAFSAWISDRAVGLDAIMPAPTRELVAELNRRARDHRLDGAPAGQDVRLGDGNRASVVPPTLHDHPVWGAYLAKRSRLVADLAAQVQDHACQGDAEPVWGAPGSHLSTALVGEVAVWRAANGINPQDPRPTGGAQLETLPALWKQHLDRAFACATDPPQNARTNERQAAHTALRRWHDDRQRPYQTPERRPNWPAAPAR